MAKSFEELVEHFEGQFEQQLEEATRQNEPPDVSMASGMLIVITALIAKDGPTLGYQLRAMHKALRNVGERRGWGVGPNDGS